MSLPLKELIKIGQTQLKEAGIGDADRDARDLYCFLDKIDAVGLMMHWQDTLQDNACEAYFDLIQRRAAGEPMQYITGVQEFMGIPFKVTPQVLIPRQDTETLVETLLSYAKDKPGTSLIDVCTGSGCIAVSLAHYGNFAQVTASDISSAALLVAKKNAADNHASVQFFESDLLEQVPGRFDMIVSNPPYIEDDVILGLEPEVKDNEPMIALSGGKDGLIFYRRLTETAKDHLNPGGALFVEIGYNQWEAVAELFRANGFSKPTLVRDLAGLDRVVWGVLDEI